MMMNIRRASIGDAEALLRIYAQYINTPVTFETELPSISEFEKRIGEVTAFYPYLVCEADGEVVGYAYAHRFKERAAYRFGAELSVYVENGLVGRGIGKALYRVLIELLKLQKVKTVYGCITLPNEASVGLHQALGFTEAGVFRRSGYKCGKWHDVIWLEKQIGGYGSSPDEPIGFSNLESKAVSAILAGC